MISFVGAGPGDIELLTLKGQRRLLEADVVIYDRLVNPLMLYLCSKECQFIYVGKTPYQNSLQQAEINDILVTAHQGNQMIVRLKGGDPEIFGRLTEELTACQEAEIPFEIIPGITAASGSAAYNGFSLTERGIARGVSFVTGTVKAESEIPDYTFTKDQTICLYMGIEGFKRMLPHLLAQGFHAETKVAVVGWGTYGRQEKLIGTLETIIKKIAQAKIKNPAMIIIGEVVGQSEKFSWFEKLPRYHQRLLLISSKAPELSELTDFTQQGADIWWHQVGSERDQRFDEISERYLSEHPFAECLFMDQAAEELYEKEIKAG